MDLLFTERRWSFMLTVEVGVLVACVTELGASLAAIAAAAATAAAALVGPDAQLRGWSSPRRWSPLKSRSKTPSSSLFPSLPPFLNPLILRCLLIQNMFRGAISPSACNSLINIFFFFFFLPNYNNAGIRSCIAQFTRAYIHLTDPKTWKEHVLKPDSW